jgi:hypothetical protein
MSTRLLKYRTYFLLYGKMKVESSASGYSLVRMFVSGGPISNRAVVMSDIEAANATQQVVEQALNSQQPSQFIGWLKMTVHFSGRNIGYGVSRR